MAIAKAAGFVITADALRLLISADALKKAQTNEVSEEELEGVAGGDDVVDIQDINKGVQIFG